MIKAVIFDYGGVVKTAHPFSMDIDKVIGLSESELQATEKERREIAILANNSVISDQEFWERFSKIIGKQLPTYDCVEQAKQSYREAFEFIPEILELARELRARNIKTAVLSNIFKFSADVIREKHGYDGFEPVILSYEVGINKPEPEIYRLTLEKLNLKSGECIFVDDQEKNLMPAEKLGIKTVLFENPKQAVKEINAIIESENKK